ncbi:MAG: hypothetical protein ABW133_02710 [Polyangiaceae bacterium]
MRNFWLAALVAVAGCSNDPLPPPDVELLIGQETDTWTADPAPTRVRIDLVTATERKNIGESNAPVSVITVKDPQVASGTIATVEATGTDAAGGTAVHGQSVPYVIYGFANATIPLFVGRPSMWSRPPQQLEHIRNFPVVTVIRAQLVLSVGGEGPDLNPAIPDVYDAVNWKAGAGEAALARAPKSIAIVRRGMLLINDNGATWIDLDGYESPNEPAAPAGLSFAEVSGGEVFELTDGTAYVVGATRLGGEPTNKVLRIDRYGFMRVLTLSVPRRGAAAGIVAGSLVVWGGSAEGAGAEVMNKAQEAFTSLPYPPDPSSGLGLATLEGNTAIVAGGKDAMTGAPLPMRTFDVTCAADCAAADSLPLPVALSRTHIYPVTGQMLVTGDAEDGEFRAFSVVTTSGTAEVVERPLRERRKAATSVLLPNGQPAVLGGHNPETMEGVRNIESFFF